MKRSILLLVISFAALCFSAAPARAKLFDFTVTNLDMDYAGTGAAGTYTAFVNTSSGVITLGNSASTSSNFPTPGLSDFSITLPISGITGTGTDLDPYSAISTGGTFTLTDEDGGILDGAVVGAWGMTKDDPDTPEVEPSIPSFFGTLTGVMFDDSTTPLDPTDDTFDGESGGPVSMYFPFSPEPWGGWMTHITAPGATWFADGEWAETVTGGSLYGVVVPVPAAVLLGMLGLSVAGVKLRKFA